MEHATINPVELDGRELIIRHYTEPPNHVPKGIFTHADGSRASVVLICLCDSVFLQLLTEISAVTDIVNFSPLRPTIQSGSLRFRSFKYIFMQLYFITK